MSFRPFLAAAGVALALMPSAGLPAAEPARPALARPDGKAADQTRKVKVFILLGQSNMLGFGRVGPKEVKGSLEYLIHAKGMYGFLKDEAGGWAVRKDVRNVHVMDKRGVDYKDLEQFQDVTNDWLKVKGNFGPEIGFGWVMGQALDEPVLVLKACIGNRALGWDLLPPGSERYEFGGKMYAGYKDVAPAWDKGAEPKAVPWYAGRQYDADTAHARAVLKNLEKYYPGYAGQGYEVAGFVWWQGHRDTGTAAYASRYEENLVRLIGSLRRDFGAPTAKFVLATGCGNPGTEGPGKAVAEAQLAVIDASKYPQFRGNVRALDTRDLWRDAAVSPANQGYHYNHNAETYLETGLRLGWAMADLLKVAGN
jgi:alpha-galactosidase